MTGVKSKQSAIVLYDYYVLFVCCTAVSKDKRCFFDYLDHLFCWHALTECVCGI